MPRSQTPVGSCALAIARPGLLPSGACQPSAFPSHLRDILLSTTIHISGLHHAACVLATPGFVRPLTGRHAGALLTGWLGFGQVGLEPPGSHPLGNNNLFHGVISNPKVSGFPWREQALVRGFGGCAASHVEGTGTGHAFLAILSRRPWVVVTVPTLVPCARL
jgi:hypothetical protein